MPEKDKCAAVYLARKVDGMTYLPRFLGSLQACSAGRNFDLIVILKGYADGDIPACLHDFWCPGLQTLHLMTFDDSRFATEAFFRAAEIFDHSALLFFVSSSRVLAGNWARTVFDVLLGGPHRLVGACSGLESLDASTPYPNPAIRTTGFAIRRKDFLSLERGDVSVRFGGNLFEAGPASMTKQMMRRGAEILVVGRDGRSFPPEMWRVSATFRLSRQENLLFADNRTDQFELARRAKRRMMVSLNWGDEVPVVRVSTAVVYFRRIRAAVVRLWWCLAGTRLISR